jgi:hypothetical protein
VATPGPTKRGKFSLILGAILAALTLGAVLASGAELFAAEVDGTANDVTVTQGTSANFNVKLSASGAISSAVTPASPSTAKVATAFSISAGGTLTAGSLSAAKNFYAPSTCTSGNCTITWEGAPTPYDVPATVTADAATPLGNYTITLSNSAGTTVETNPNSTGAKLEDKDATTITVHVVAPAVTDTDGDGVADPSDNCPTVANAGQANNDGDSEGDACDADDDNDGVADDADNCVLTSNSDQSDNDGDGQGDACDSDDDGDGVADDADNCLLTSNSDQSDNDGDGQGDACDADDDNDTVTDDTDNCQFAPNTDQSNNDGDAQGDACDADDDNDGVNDGADNCPLISNSDQSDNDGDGAGDVCDSDDDNDGVADDADNCPLAANTDQANADGDTLGDACDPNAFAPEVGTAAADDSGHEGDTLTTSGSFTDGDGNGTLTISKVSGAGDVTDNGDGTWSWSYATTDDGAGGVVVQASDGEHAAATDSFDWSAANVPPSATFNAPAEVDEGSDINISLSDVVDPGSADTHQYRFSCDGGTSWTAYGASASHSCSTTDNGTKTVKGQVKDDDGGESAEYSANVTVKNVPPTVDTVTVAGGTGVACLAGNPAVNLSFTFHDPGVDDANWAVDIDWGDGSTHTTDSLATQSGTKGPYSHTYAPGTYTPKVTVTDKDSGSGNKSATAGSVAFLYNMTGILPPFNSDGTSVWKYGSTLPTKVKITDCDGNPVPNLKPKIGTSMSSSVPPTIAVDEATSTSAADNDSVLRFDSTGGQYIYNYASKTLPDSSATYYMYVRGTDANGVIVTSPAQVSQKFGIKPK